MRKCINKKCYCNALSEKPPVAFYGDKFGPNNCNMFFDGREGECKIAELFEDENILNDKIRKYVLNNSHVDGLLLDILKQIEAEIMATNDIMTMLASNFKRLDKVKKDKQ